VLQNFKFNGVITKIFGQKKIIIQNIKKGKKKWIYKCIDWLLTFEIKQKS
jgi:hypothetical protein